MEEMQQPEIHNVFENTYFPRNNPGKLHKMNGPRVHGLFTGAEKGLVINKLVVFIAVVNMSHGLCFAFTQQKFSTKKSCPCN